MGDKDSRMEKLTYDRSNGAWLIGSVQMKVQKNNVATHKYPESGIQHEREKAR